MAQIMDETQRTEALASYNPKDHLIAVGRDKATGKAVLYYPAAWRLYELHLRYANANFKSEILYHDEQKGTVIVKAYLYLGKSYEDSDKKAEAMKQGNINTLDKLETAAKARCARDFGVGTEYALDMTPDETDAVHDAPATDKGVTSNRAQTTPEDKGQTKSGVTSPVTQPATNGTTNPVTSNETVDSAQSKIAPPTVKELQDRCNAIWGVGFWQTMLQKATKQVDVAFLAKDITEEVRIRASSYMDKAEAMKANKSTGKYAYQAQQVTNVSHMTC